MAITRAKDELFLTACHYRRIHGRIFETVPSRFLTEIDPELITAERSTATAKAASYQAGYGQSYSARAAGADRGGQVSSFGHLRGGGDWPVAGSGRGSSAGGQVSDEDEKWRTGQAVYHEDYGAGVIVQVKPTPSSGPLVVVRFESGHMAQFFTKFTKKLEIEE